MAPDRVLAEQGPDGAENTFFSYLTEFVPCSLTCSSSKLSSSISDLPCAAALRQKRPFTYTFDVDAVSEVNAAGRWMLNPASRPLLMIEMRLWKVRFL